MKRTFLSAFALLASPALALASGGPLPSPAYLCAPKGGNFVVRVVLEAAISSEDRGEAFLYKGPTKGSELFSQTDSCYEAARVTHAPALPAWAQVEGAVVCGSERHEKGPKGDLKTILSPNKRGVRVVLLKGASGNPSVKVEGGSFSNETFECKLDSAG